MNILFGVQHPKHVYLFKNVIKNLQERGHNILVTSVHKEVTEELLTIYNIPFVSIGTNKEILTKKAMNLLFREFRTFQIIRRFKPDLLIGRALPYFAHMGKLFHIPFIIFEDTELSFNLHRITVPFASCVITPKSYRGNINNIHIRYNGYDELAYLHPIYFSPEEKILEKLHLSNKDKIITIRFISRTAYHDVSLSGIDDRIDFVEKLQHLGQIIISSEAPLPDPLKKFQIQITPNEIHSLLYYSSLYIGEGGTMAIESATLGTPSIHIEGDSKGNPTGDQSGNFIDYRDKYGLLYYYANKDEALVKAKEILRDPNSKKVWKEKREKLIQDNIDVTEWITNFILKFPDSLKNQV